MNLPRLEEPQRYHGLYIYDFGEWTALGYTADEIAVLLESDEYEGGQIYKIHRAYPDGRLELRGVAAERFQSESGMFFYRATLDAAQTDLAELRDAGLQTPPPCRTFLHLADRGAEVEAARFVTVLIFPAEFEHEIGQWLSAIGYAGGTLVEGGISHVSNYNSEDKNILERHQLWNQAAIQSRRAAEVLASVRRAVQR
ncbi:MAG: hypothetical protein ABIG44_07105 [Planctomycetota bacterium]